LRAFDRDAELIVGTDPDGRCRAAFMKSADPIGTQGVVLSQATAVHKRVALESLLTVAVVRPPDRAPRACQKPRNTRRPPA